MICERQLGSDRNRKSSEGKLEPVMTTPPFQFIIIEKELSKQKPGGLEVVQPQQIPPHPASLSLLLSLSPPGKTKTSRNELSNLKPDTYN